MKNEQRDAQPAARPERLLGLVHFFHCSLHSLSGFGFVAAWGETYINPGLLPQSGERGQDNHFVGKTLIDPTSSTVSITPEFSSRKISPPKTRVRSVNSFS